MNEPTITFPMLGEKFRLDFPSYFTLFGWKFHFYGTIIAVGFLLALLYVMRHSEDLKLSRDNILDVLICAMPAAIVAARAYYVIFNFGLYRNDFWGIFEIWEGGLAVYGGVIGGVIAGFIFCRVKKLSFGAALDMAALGLLIGQCIGRWANFVNREAHGAETDVFCRMGLTTEAGTVYYHPTFLYESLWNFIGFIALSTYMKKRKTAFPGELFTLYMFWYGLGRAWIEGLRTDSLYLFGTGVRVSQLIAVVSAIAGAVLFIHNKRKAGKIADSNAE